MKNLFTFFCLFFATAANAQGEANNWVFGHNAHITWNSGVPVAFFSNSSMDQLEGVSSISNEDGDLLFYSDGMKVWNRLDQQMPNGIGLMGDYSTTQSVVIVPWPGHTSKYFLFTQDELTGTNGFRYSVVDMSLQGGLGDVVAASKNTLLYNPSCEKLTVTSHANGIDFWVATHQWNTNAFYTYLVTAAGVDTTPVISNVGVIHGLSIGNSAGYMKFSPDGGKLALCLYSDNFVEAVQFNKNTGQIGPLLFHQSYTNTSVEELYGLEFSPNSNLLYVMNVTYNGTLYQYNLQAADIPGSRFLVADSISYGAALQLAVDKKIYASHLRDSSLSAINNPNVIGAGCGYQTKAVLLASGTSCNLGLPNFVQSYFASYSDFAVQNTCLGAATAFSITNAGADSTLWNFGDIASGATNSSTLTNPSHVFSSADTFNVTLRAWKGGTLDSSVKQVIVHTLPVATISISVNGDTLTSYNGVTYQWYLNGNIINGAIDNMYEAKQGGSYTVAITDTNGCSAVSNPVIISGINNLSPAFSVNVYPNPLDNGFWNLECATNMLGSLIEIFDADGRLVFESKIIDTNSQIELNAQRGIYMLRISSANNAIVRKLIRL